MLYTVYILSLVIVDMGIDKRATLPPPPTTPTCNKNCKKYICTDYVCVFV